MKEIKINSIPKKIYSVKDIKENRYDYPFLFKNDELAIRALKEQIERKNILYINDKELWCIGEFDEERGEIISTEKEFIGALKEYEISQTLPKTT